MSIINIHVIIDGSAISNKYTRHSTNPRRPVIIDVGDVFMITEAAALSDPASQASSHLQLLAQADSVIRWQGNDQAINSGFSAIIYDITPSNNHSIFSPITPRVRSVATPIPARDNQTLIVDPLQVTVVSVPVYYLIGLVNEPGDVDVLVRFYISTLSATGTFT
ncbi:MAG: AidA/PixA family protein, partial [Rhizomicrobium sp.]